ncbi:MAG TPA: winged helix DNA-binding domain-containing protein [Actinomycetota bacterium]|nr:winged helix DNA-binding domain-containing protein [Actinomycetota bacterium]
MAKKKTSSTNKPRTRKRPTPKDIAVAARLSWPQVLAFRLARHHLDERVTPDRLLDVVRDLCGVHAQVMSSAELTALVRIDGLERDMVADALWRDRTLVKTWAMRGTLHLVPADELSLWNSALAATYVDWYLGPDRLQWIGLSRDQIGAVTEAVATTLDRSTLTRDELMARVADILGDPDLAAHVGGGWGTLLKPVAFAGRLCFAENEGRNVRFTNPRKWVRGYKEVPPARAIPEVVRRFFRTYGPAGVPEFQRWWAVRPAQIRAMVATIADELVDVEVEGRRMRLHVDDLDAIKRAGRPSGVRLLPAFDQYVVNVTRNVDHILRSELKDRVYRQAAWVSQIVLVEGRMAGVWKHERKGKRFIARVEPFETFNGRTRKSVEREAERYAAFYDATLELEWVD